MTEFALPRTPPFRALLWFSRATAALGRNVGAERDRWVLWLPVAIGAGVASYFALPVEPPLWAGASILVLVAAVGLRARGAAVVCAVAFSAGALGFSAAQVRTALVTAPVLAREIGPVAVTGRAVEVELRPADRRITLDHLTIATVAAADTPARVRVTVRARGGDTVVPGDQIQLRAVLTPPPRPAAPGGFDFSRQAWFERLGGVGYAVNAPVLTAPHAARWQDGLSALRHSLSLRIRAAIPGQAGALAAALMTGDRGGIADSEWQAMRDSGLAHLVSISGLHFGLVAAILFFVVRAVLAAIEPVALSFPVKKWAATAALAGSFGYLLLAGFNAPTERSFLMLALVLLGVLLDRRALSMHAVAWAAAAILLFAPDLLLGPSFQMSFAAVIALIAFYETFGDRLAAWRRQFGVVGRAALYVGGVGLTTLVASVATTPFALFHFDRVTTFGIAANLIAVPLTGVWIMPLAVAAFALMPLGLEQLALVPMGWGTAWVLDVARLVAAWPGAAISLPAMPVAGLALIGTGGLWLCLWQQRWRWAGAAAVVLGLATLGTVRAPDVLISDDGGYLAVRAADGGLRASSTRANFTVDEWLTADGLTRAKPWPKAGAVSDDGMLRCDGVGCTYRAQGRIVALARSREALVQDCRHADVVVATVSVFVPCAAPVVVDRLDLWRDGAFAVWLGGETPRAVSVDDRRGRRPWVLPRGDWE